MPCSFHGGLAVSGPPAVCSVKNEDKGWGRFESTATDVAADTNCRRVTRADMAWRSFNREQRSIVSCGNSRNNPFEESPEIAQVASSWNARSQRHLTHASLWREN